VAHSDGISKFAAMKRKQNVKFEGSASSSIRTKIIPFEGENYSLLQVKSNSTSTWMYNIKNMSENQLVKSGSKQTDFFPKSRINHAGAVQCSPQMASSLQTSNIVLIYGGVSGVTKKILGTFLAFDLESLQWEMPNVQYSGKYKIGELTMHTMSKFLL
jgi:hypothetical protein